MAGQCAAQTESGRLITDETCQVKGIPNLWAAGDCAAVPHPEAGYCPANAQFAMRQGTHLARNIERLLHGEDLLPFRFKGLGEMASIGHRSAVAEIMGVTFSGFFAWWLWRTVYLMKLPRFDRKLRVMLDWTLELFFPRDINLLNPRFSTRLQEVYLEPGDLLCRQGEPAFSFYIVQNGCIHLTDDQGLVRVVGAGDYFGERALLGDGVWQFDAKASEPSTLVPVPASIFHQIVRGSGSLGRLFQRSAGKYHSRQVIQRIAGRIHNGAGPRTAAEWMTAQVHTLSPDDRLRDAFRLAKSHPHSSYPVVDAEGQILGAIHREDLLEFLKQPESSLDRPLSAFPISTLPIVPPDTRTDELVARLVRTGASKLLVADSQNRLKGIVTVMDLIAMADSEGARLSASELRGE
jgi:NADH:ubiquinone reductase (H+-translocating)